MVAGCGAKFPEKSLTGNKIQNMGQTNQHAKENFLKKGQVKFHKDLSFVLAHQCFSKIYLHSYRK